MVVLNRGKMRKRKAARGGIAECATLEHPPPSSSVRLMSLISDDVGTCEQDSLVILVMMFLYVMSLFTARKTPALHYMTGWGAKQYTISGFSTPFCQVGQGFLSFPYLRALNTRIFVFTRRLWPLYSFPSHVKYTVRKPNPS